MPWTQGSMLPASEPPSSNKRRANCASQLSVRAAPSNRQPAQATRPLSRRRGSLRLPSEWSQQLPAVAQQPAELSVLQ
jgi:hypothetical protein